MRRGLLFSLFAIFIFVGCSKKTTTSSGCADSTGLTCPGEPELAYCSSTKSYSNSVTITGTAEYIRREPYSGGLGNASLSGTHPSNAYPIRFAEVRVVSGDTVFQCATTDATGNFSFQLPKGSISYTIQVNSRAKNSHLVASVLDKPATNKFYSLKKSVTPNASKSVGTLTATATGAVLSGAFNILDQIAFANQYLASVAGSCSTTNAGCANFTVAPKVSAYWVSGFNPNSYFGSDSSGLSFYLPGYSKLFILGGINGNTSSSDTDTFDNSVIIHEYGHFLEDSMFASDSPGGPHNGNKVIDPRLAWSEGWGNFFQAAVTNSSFYNDPAYNYVLCQTTYSGNAACPSEPFYGDTLGNADGTTSMAFHVDLEDMDAYDDPNFDGEGNFREFAVTRFLWDVVDSNNDTQYTVTDNITNQFVQIWASLTKSSLSFKSGSLPFKNIGLLHLLHTDMAGSNTWNAVQGMNRHDGDESEYAQYVSTGTTCSYSITPASVAGDNGDYVSSDLFRNNNFYHLKISSAGTYTIRLDYIDANTAGFVADLDLYVYNESAQFAVASDVVKYTRKTPTQTPTATQTESVSVTLPRGNYLVNVNVFTGGTLGGAVNYTLKLNGSQLCPDDLF